MVFCRPASLFSCYLGRPNVAINLGIWTLLTSAARPAGDQTLEAQTLAPRGLLVAAASMERQPRAGRPAGARTRPFPAGGKETEYENGLVVPRCAPVKRRRWAAGKPVAVHLEVKSYGLTLAAVIVRLRRGRPSELPIPAIASIGASLRPGPPPNPRSARVLPASGRRGM